MARMKQAEQPQFTPQQLDGLPMWRAESMVDEVIDAGYDAMERFGQALDNGSSVRFAHMCALRRPPGTLGTDRAFMEGRLNNQQFDSMGEWMRNYVLSTAKKAGIDINGKYWNGTIGRPDNPLAWVGDISDVKRAARVKQGGMEGMINQDAPQVEPAKPVKLAPDIAQRLMQERIAQDKALAERVKKSPKAREQLRQEIIHRHGNPKVKES